MCTDDLKEAVEESKFSRSEPFKARRAKQVQTVDFPTTTIGSFPQTPGEFFTGSLHMPLHPLSRGLCTSGLVDACCQASSVLPTLCASASGNADPIIISTCA